MGKCCNNRRHNDTIILDSTPTITSYNKGIYDLTYKHIDNTTTVKFSNPHKIPEDEIIANLAYLSKVDSLKKFTSWAICPYDILKLLLISGFGLSLHFYLESWALGLLSRQIALGLFSIVLIIYAMYADKKINGMEVAQSSSILILWGAQLLGLFYPKIGLPLPHWHHILLMSFILLVTQVIKRWIRTPPHNEIKARKTSIFNAPLSKQSTITLKGKSYLPFDAKLTADCQVKAEIVRGEGNEWVDVNPQLNTVFAAGTYVKAIKEVKICKEQGEVIKFSQDSGIINSLTKNFHWLLLTATTVSAIVAFILHNNVISAITSTLVIACPCIFSVVDPIIIAIAKYKLKDYIKINDNRIKPMQLFYNIANTKNIIWDVNGTLKKANKKELRPEIYTCNRQFENLSQQYVTGSKEPDKTQWFENKNFTTLPLYIGDGPNDAAVWRNKPQKIISGCVKSNWGHSVSKWACFSLQHDDFPLHGLPILYKVSKWAKNTQLVCHTIAFIYTITVFALTIMGYIANPMLACALLCASALFMGLIVISSAAFAPEVSDFKPQQNSVIITDINTLLGEQNDNIRHLAASQPSAS